MDVKKIKDEIRRENAPQRTGGDYLKMLTNSKQFTDADWGSWASAGTDELEHRIGHLGFVLFFGMRSPPDRKPVRSKEKRKKLADKVRNQLCDLVAVLRAIQGDEAYTWKNATLASRDKALRNIAAEHPNEKWQRTVPPMVYLGEGWEMGVEASLESLPLLLDAFKDTVDAWEADECWPFDVRKKKGENADRTYFVKVATKMFRDRYERPLNNVVASLTCVLFPKNDPQLTEKMVSKIGKSS